MRQHRSRHSTSFLAGLLVGVLTGSAVALLGTPRPGRQIREAFGRELKRSLWRIASLDLHDWGAIVEEENRRRLVKNLERIRAAGL